MKIFNLDRLDAYQNRSEQGDGFFDFVDGITVDASNGRIIFTQVEPFGEYLFEQFSSDVTEDYEIEGSYNGNQRQYVYRSLYELTKTAALQQADANRFLLRGLFAAGTDVTSITSKCSTRCPSTTAFLSTRLLTSSARNTATQS